LQELTTEKLKKMYNWVGEPRENRRRVRKDGKWFHVLLNGSPAYFAKRYYSVRDFHEGRALVCEIIDGAKVCYHILYNGQPAYPERFDDGTDFKNHRALMLKNKERFYIGPNGERIN
jgi:hypothetical protein